MSKSIFASRIFWVNLVSALLEIAQLFTGTTLIPPGYLTLGVNALNIILRRMTVGDVHVVTPREVK
jgi:hypothetical protein